MHKRFDHSEIEQKWRTRWREQNRYNTRDTSEKPKCYVLDMFPYPSGEGLHVGHPKGYIATDIYSRYKRMNGHEVLHPMGWDAFGLPAENFAIKHNTHPRQAVEQNVARFKEQLEILGFDYDWSREINTTDPNYYKWTQWIFTKLFEQGLAYESNEPINWCPGCQTGLANEDVEPDGTCERCDSPVEQKPMRQWILKIREYADRMLEDLDTLQWPEHIKEAQRNWIGKSEGAELCFGVNTGSPQTVLLLHGTGGSRESNWQPWLAEKLERLGIQVLNIDLPNPMEPSMDDWIRVAEEAIAQARGQITVVGHSLGCTLALQLTQRNAFKKLILVAPPHANCVEWERLHGVFPEPTVQALDAFISTSIDFETVRENTQERLAIFSTDDPYIPVRTQEAFAQEDFITQRFTDMGHFNEGAGVLSLPALLPEIPNTVTVFTTRPDTLYGATYMVLAPEHALITQNQTKIENWSEVEAYIQAAANKKEMDRLDDTKEKTGVQLKGITATNPANGEEILVYIADYVLASYGTGAIMAVPAHDERDFAFAKKYNLPITQVVAPVYSGEGDDAPRDDVETNPARGCVDIIIEHPTDGTFLLQREKDGDRELVHFVGGGTDGDDDITAVARELTEETGFSDFEFVSTKPVFRTKSIGYRHSKGINQQGVTGFYHIKLKNLEQKPSEIEEGKHTVEWVPANQVAERITWAWHLRAWHALHNQIHTGTGVLVHSGEFDGMDSEEAKRAITEKVGGRMTSTYKIKDWVFSRQRYWGEPIPIVHCEKCGPVAVPEEQLPVTLPEVERYEPAGDGQSPLANITKWVNTECPACGGPGKRETNTMPQWAGSSWYYLRFMDPQNDRALVDPEKEQYWAPVDVYVGGDHAVRHLIYARFWHKFLSDIGVVSTLEPFQRLEFLGFILAEDGRKMSKRWGNIINPDDIVKLVGADTLRVYEMFMGPFENTIAWSQDGLAGARRFLERVNGLAEHITETEPEDTTRQLHKTIRKVQEDIEAFKFNTAVSAMMIFLNQAEKTGLSASSYQQFLQLLAPFAPHLTEELWVTAGGEGSVHTAVWPPFDPDMAQDDVVTIGVQIDGKHRGEITIAPDASEAEAVAAAQAEPALAERLTEQTVKKVIYVPGRILNFLLT